MSKGILFFSFNNSKFDYIKLTEFAATRARTFLNAPVSIITDSVSAKNIKNKTLFDKIIIIDNQTEIYFQKTFLDGNTTKEKAEWKNSHRNSAFYLTPYEETLVLDSDYIVNSDLLSYCWNQPNDFLIYSDSYNLSRKVDVPYYMSEYSIPYYWATVFYFKKTPLVKSFFDIVSYVKENWNFYKNIYKIDSATFRNDYAFTIAIHMLNGFHTNTFVKSLPGKMFYITDRDYCIDIKNDHMKFLIRAETDCFIPLKISNTDVHIMNKFSLSRIIDG